MHGGDDDIRCRRFCASFLAHLGTVYTLINRSSGAGQVGFGAKPEATDVELERPLIARKWTSEAALT